MSRSRKALLRWIKDNGLVTFGIIGSALTIFQGLEPFLRFSRLALWIVDHWRHIAAVPWTWLGSLIDVQIRQELALICSFLVFILIFCARINLHSRQSNQLLSPNWVIFHVGYLTMFLAVSSIVIINRPATPEASIGGAVAFGSFWSVLSMRIIDKMTYRIVVMVWLTVCWTIALLVTWHLLRQGPPDWNPDLPSYGGPYGGYILLFLLITGLPGCSLLAGGQNEKIMTFLRTGATNATRTILLVVVFVYISWIGVYAPDIKAWIDNTTSVSP